MAEPERRPDAEPEPRPDVEPGSTASAAEPVVSVERVGTEAVLLRFNLKDGSLDLADEDDEPVGGDAACWAHLFEDEPDVPEDGPDAR
jgi:hypothetical protein